MVKSILFVCTGNLCRSPMAEGIMKKELENYPSRELKVSSAGVLTVDGRLASGPAILVMSEMGIDIMGHHSTRITEKLIRDSDLIVVMETMHREVLLSMAPELNERIKILGDYLPGSNNNRDIDDPYGLGLAEYRQCARQIHACVKNLIQKELMENN
jgi:protein-tyrosine-phosphatase